MHSPMMYLVILVLLVITLSVQVQVLASPIPFPAAIDAKTQPEATFEAMVPTKIEVFERAEVAIAKFIAERATITDDDESGAHTDDAAVGSAFADGDGNSAATENHETGAGITPIPPPTKPGCIDICPAVWEPLCAHNKLGDKKTFGNRCKLNLWNCRHHFNTYVEDHKGECSTQ
ncbi:hypothetical protein BG015_004676 [Linnemannia schmuckeri]|uniref:Kazal-like domain-containing protein n=1 Tax=Linnemannia schmuckeri TaxID=64567 RepID=A0A9P5RA49_9FUNG|nr:hypothetical protein BG015_004676 [Linnemannia schmuckeri]